MSIRLNIRSDNRKITHRDHRNLPHPWFVFSFCPGLKITGPVEGETEGALRATGVYPSTGRYIYGLS